MHCLFQGSEIYKTVIAIVFWIKLKPWYVLLSSCFVASNLNIDFILVLVKVLAI